MKKGKKNLKALVHGIFYGMKSADDIISTKASYGSSETAIVQEQAVDNLYNDLLRGEETQRVKEFRDEFYRSIHEASKIGVSVNVSGGNFDEDFDNDNIEITATSKKKTALDFVCKIDVFNPEKLHLKCIQDNLIVPKKGAFTQNLEKVDNTYFKTNQEVGGLLSDEHVSIFKIERDGFIPRFKLEDYFNKLVIRVIDEKTSYLDFYVSVYSSQFGFVYTEGKNGKTEIKKDNSALLISELNKLYKKELRTSDVVDFSTLTFDTEKAYGVPNPSHFEFDKIQYIGTNIFDGNFVVTMKANNVVNGLSAIDKYHTDELDEKLETHAVREGKDVDLTTAMRHAEKEREKLDN